MLFRTSCCPLSCNLQLTWWRTIRWTKVRRDGLLIDWSKASNLTAQDEAQKSLYGRVENINSGDVGRNDEWMMNFGIADEIELNWFDWWSDSDLDRMMWVIEQTDFIQNTWKLTQRIENWREKEKRFYEWLWQIGTRQRGREGTIHSIPWSDYLLEDPFGNPPRPENCKISDKSSVIQIFTPCFFSKFISKYHLAL